MKRYNRLFVLFDYDNDEKPLNVRAIIIKGIFFRIFQSYATNRVLIFSPPLSFFSNSKLGTFRKVYECVHEFWYWIVKVFPFEEQLVTNCRSILLWRVPNKGVRSPLRGGRRGNTRFNSNHAVPSSATMAWAGDTKRGKIKGE